MTGKAGKNGIVPYRALIEDATPLARVHHDSSYVTHLIAEAAGLPQMPRRRRLERQEAVVAYAVTDIVTLPRSNRIRRSA